MKTQLRFGGTGSAAAACVSPQVVNSATMSVDANIVPGELVTLTGLGIGPEVGVAAQRDSQGQIPRETGGVQVLFDDQPAPILYAQSRQINAMAPVELRGRTQTKVTVVYQKSTLGPITAAVDAFGAPGIFRIEQGISARAAAQNQDGTINSSSNPAPRGSVVAVWGTGFGLLDPTCATGGLNPDGPVKLSEELIVLIAEATPPGTPTITRPAQYAGSAPTLSCGVVQINLLVPETAAAGENQFFPWSTLRHPAGDSLVRMGTVGVTIFVK